MRIFLLRRDWTKTPQRLPDYESQHIMGSDVNRVLIRVSVSTLQRSLHRRAAQRLHRDQLRPGR